MLNGQLRIRVRNSVGLRNHVFALDLFYILAHAAANLSDFRQLLTSDRPIGLASARICVLSTARSTPFNRPTFMHCWTIRSKRSRKSGDS